MMFLYPVAIFKDKKIRTVGVAISLIAVIALTVVGLLHPPVYSTEIMGNNEEHPFDDTYQVSLADEKYGSVKIEYVNGYDDYMIHGDFKKAGNTILILESPDTEIIEYDLSVERNTYELKQR